MESRDPQLAAISAKAIKEARYHLRFSRGWLERLGNGTDVSGQKMQQAIDKLWRFTAELFDADEIDIALRKRVLRLIHALYAQRGKPKFLPGSTKPH